MEPRAEGGSFTREKAKGRLAREKKAEMSHHVLSLDDVQNQMRQVKEKGAL